MHTQQSCCQLFSRLLQGPKTTRTQPCSSLVCLRGDQIAHGSSLLSGGGGDRVSAPGGETDGRQSTTCVRPPGRQSSAMDDIYRYPVYFDSHSLLETQIRRVENYFRVRRRSGGGDCGRLRRAADRVYSVAFKYQKGRPQRHRALPTRPRPPGTQQQA